MKHGLVQFSFAKPSALLSKPLLSYRQAKAGLIAAAVKAGLMVAALLPLLCSWHTYVQKKRRGKTLEKKLGLGRETSSTETRQGSLMSQSNSTPSANATRHDQPKQLGLGRQPSSTRTRQANLISHEHQALLFTEDDKLGQVLVAQHAAHGVARVDDHQALGHDAVRPRLVHASLHPLRVCARVCVHAFAVVCVCVCVCMRVCVCVSARSSLPASLGAVVHAQRKKTRQQAPEQAVATSGCRNSKRQRRKHQKTEAEGTSQKTDRNSKRQRQKAKVKEGKSERRQQK